MARAAEPFPLRFVLILNGYFNNVTGHDVQVLFQGGDHGRHQAVGGIEADVLVDLQRRGQP